MKPHSRIILILLVVQAAITGYLIALSFAPSIDEEKFALVLVSELILFAMMTYIFRTERLQETPSPAWIAVGGTIVVGFLVSSVVFVP